jgi:hypothetical protein
MRLRDEGTLLTRHVAAVPTPGPGVTESRNKAWSRTAPRAGPKERALWATSSGGMPARAACHAPYRSYTSTASRSGVAIAPGGGRAETMVRKCSSVRPVQRFVRLPPLEHHHIRLVAAGNVHRKRQGFQIA